MRYRNTVTGAEIDVPCRIGGENWEEVISSQQTAGVSAPGKEAPAAVDETAAVDKPPVVEETTAANKAATAKKPEAKKPTAKKSGTKRTTGKATKK